MKKFSFLALTALVTIGLATLTSSTAGAQYPPPAADDIVLVTGDVAPAVGETVSVAATVTDPAGDPVAGAVCTFAIASQPGSDASVESGPVTTNADGVAATLLDVGSTAGTIIVEASCDELSASISVVAGAAEGPAAPPASVPELPATGFGPGEGSGGSNATLWTWIALTLIAGAGALYLSLTVMRRAWR